MRVVDPSLLDAGALRVRTRFDRMEALSAVLHRPDALELLDPDDRMLLELSVSLGRSTGFVAKYLGWKPSRVRRRLAHFRRAIALPVVVMALEARTPMTERCRQVALRHLLRGESIARIARRLRMCPRSVSRHLAYLKGWSSATSYLAGRLAEVRSRAIAEEEKSR